MLPAKGFLLLCGNGLSCVNNECVLGLAPSPELFCYNSTASGQANAEKCEAFKTPGESAEPNTDGSDGGISCPDEFPNLGFCEKSCTTDTNFNADEFFL